MNKTRVAALFLVAAFVGATGSVSPALGSPDGDVGVTACDYRLGTLKAYKTQDGNRDEIEVYVNDVLKREDLYFYDGDSYYLNIPINYRDNVKLMEYDWPDPNDFLGQKTINGPGTYTFQKYDGAELLWKYNLYVTRC